MSSMSTQSFVLPGGSYIYIPWFWGKRYASCPAGEDNSKPLLQWAKAQVHLYYIHRMPQGCVSSMLAPSKKTNYTTYDPSTCVHHFLNGITNPALTQAKLSLEANCKHYSGNFDTTIEYLMNQVQHHQVNKQLNIASVGSGAPGYLEAHDNQGNILEMPLVCYLPEKWTQLSSAQKSSICKCCAVADGKPRGTRCGERGMHGRGRGDHKRQCKNRHDLDLTV